MASFSDDDDTVELGLVPRLGNRNQEWDAEDVEIQLEPFDPEPFRKQVSRENTESVQTTKTVVTRRKTGGWKYSICKLLQAVLYARYLRCAADFLRSVIFAVGFALGTQAGACWLSEASVTCQGMMSYIATIIIKTHWSQDCIDNIPHCSDLIPQVAQEVKETLSGPRAVPSASTLSRSRFLDPCMICCVG